MKSFITPAYTFTPGASGVGTVDLSGITSFDEKRLVAIINQTKGEIIYSTGSTLKKYTAVAGTTVTLFYDTTAHVGTDKLQVIYDDPALDNGALITLTNTNIGATSEAAAATDTSTSGLNGLMKRLLQRMSSLILLLPVSIGQKNSASSLAVTISSEQEAMIDGIEANQAAAAVLVGPVNETAPASDTANSGLNGRLQRIAQRISALILQLPATLGSKTSANSLSVTLASDQVALPISTGAATSANQAAMIAEIGAVSEAAPTNDTDDSGMNGRLKKIILKLSALIAQLPATLGQKTKANSLAVAIASDQDTLNTQGATLDLTVVAGTALNTDVIPSVDVSKYKVLYIHNLNSFVGTITFQGSMDNVNWVAIQASPQASPSTVANTNFSGSNGATLSIFTVPVVSKYFRLRLTAYTSGTCNVVGMASTSQSFDYATKYFAANAPILTTSTNSTVAGTVSNAQVTVGTTAVRATVAGTAPNAARKLLMIKPSKNNAGALYYGSSTVTTSNGMEILGPDVKEFDFDAGDYYLISDTAGQTVEILEKA